MPDTWFCTACRVHIADNSAQRTQHLAGVRHQQASEKRLADIATKNREAAKKEARDSAERAAIGIGVGEEKPVRKRATDEVGDARADARAEMMLTVTRGVVRRDVEEEKVVEVVEVVAGYGEWEKVDEVVGEDAESVLKVRVGGGERRVGAVDDGDEEEARARAEEESGAGRRGNDEGVAIGFKARKGRVAKKRRK